jgi:EEF1A lysine methyltransferase 4
VKILNLGCGNSVLPEELYDKGFKNVYNVDISSVVIE